MNICRTSGASYWDAQEFKALQTVPETQVVGPAIRGNIRTTIQLDALTRPTPANTTALAPFLQQRGEFSIYLKWKVGSMLLADCCATPSAAKARTTDAYLSISIDYWRTEGVL